MTNVRIVGTALFPEADDGTFNTAYRLSERGYASGTSAHPGFDAYAREGEPPVTTSPTWHAILDQRFPGAALFFSYPSRPGDVASWVAIVSRVRWAAVAILLGSVVLLNMLLATRNRRRRELATFASLGLTSQRVAQLRRVAERRRRRRQCRARYRRRHRGRAAVWIATTDGIGVATDVEPSAPRDRYVVIDLARGAVLLGMFAGTAREARRRRVAPPRVTSPAAASMVGLARAASQKESDEHQATDHAGCHTRCPGHRAGSQRFGHADRGSTPDSAGQPVHPTA